MSELKIYNTLHRKKEVFVPIHKGFVGIYVCGPTVYGHAHLGHAKSYISYDVIVRHLRYLGYKVRYVQNITDVGHLLGETNEGEDRIVKQARIERLEPMEVVERYTKSYFDDMDALNILRPDISPRASAHIPEQIELTQLLIDKGYAYEQDGAVYFSVEKFSDYGKLSGRNVQELLSGVRVQVKDGKKNAADFALWKKAEADHLMQWNSPWGRGYPGWHAECSVMSTKYLGQPFDIHGGGLENIFPHHECEIAQSEAATGQEFAHYWIHNNMVTVNGQKMGKSLSNFVNIKDVINKYNPLSIRFFVLSSHYRSPLDFSEEALDAGQKGLQRLRESYERIKKSDDGDQAKANNFSEKITAYRMRFEKEMNDDFNTPKALAALFDFIKEINIAMDKNEIFGDMGQSIITTIDETAGDVLGLIPSISSSAQTGDAVSDLNTTMELLIELRAALRKEKNFALADFIRNRLSESGFELRDTESGTEWKK